MGLFVGVDGRKSKSKHLLYSLNVTGQSFCQFFKTGKLWFLNFLMGNLRAYGGCLDSTWR